MCVCVCVCVCVRVCATTQTIFLLTIFIGIFFFVVLCEFVNLIQFYINVARTFIPEYISQS